MRYQVLLARIDERRIALGNLSERKACIMADVGLNSIRHLRPPREHAPKADVLRKLEVALKAPPGYFVEAAAPAEEEGQTQPTLTRIFVKGDVQAGVWREAIEWPADDWWTIEAPTSPRFPGAPRFGLLVKGRSMDRIYPDGTIVIVVRFLDIATAPEPGQRVVVARKNVAGEYEATLKEYDRDERGRHILWPRSTAPEFQTPFILPPGQSIPSFAEDQLPLADDGIANIDNAGALDHDAGVAETAIVALVIGSYRPE
jgi:SOS-response transcriptional repressor LexA